MGAAALKDAGGRLFRFHNEQMGQVNSFLLGRAGAAAKEESVGFRQVLALHKQLGKGGMALVGGRRGQGHFAVTGQPETARLFALVGQDNHPDFNIVVRDNGDFHG
jgi:hypothetical protein